jgi:hypothetical protein
MPKKGYKAPPKITAEDYDNSIALSVSVTTVLSVIAKKHGDVPELLAAMSLIERGRAVLAERKPRATEGVSS